MCGCPLFVIVIQFSVGGLKTIPLQEAGCVHLMTGCSTGSGSGTSNRMRGLFESYCSKLSHGSSLCHTPSMS